MRTSSKKTAHVDLLNLTTWQHVLNILHLRNHLSVLSVCVLNRVQHFATPWTVARQAPLFMEFSGQEYWSGYLFPTLGDLHNPGKPHEIIYMLEQSSELGLPYRGGNRHREGKKLVPGHGAAERQSRDSGSPTGAQSHTCTQPCPHRRTHFLVRQFFLSYSC